MASDLKPSRTRSKKTANHKLYAAIALCALLVYLFFFTGTTPSKIATKYDSAASSITKGISGTFKDKSKTEPGKVQNIASSADKETHALVHELKKQAEGEPPSSSLVASKPKASVAPQAPGVHENQKEVTVQTTGKTGSRPKNQAYDPADSLDILFESYPMIVFSKSYCPHSKRAKTILEQYDIRPRPLIFELDVEEHGSELQAELGLRTGRKTVPNVIVNAQSIGGGDEIAELDQSDRLISKIRSLSDSIDISRKPKSR